MSDELVSRLRSDARFLAKSERVTLRDVIAKDVDEAATALTELEQDNAKLREERDEAKATVEAVKLLLYCDEVFIGSDWQGDFRDPATQVWPTFCVNFPNYGADADKIPPDQLVMLAELVRNYGNDALTAWSCWTRGIDKPIKGTLSDKGKLALADLRAGEDR